MNALKASLNEIDQGKDQEGDIAPKIEVTEDDFTVALSKVFPSVSKKDEAKYKALQSSLRKTRSSIQ